MFRKYTTNRWMLGLMTWEEWIGHAVGELGGILFRALDLIAPVDRHASKRGSNEGGYRRTGEGARSVFITRFVNRSHFPPRFILEGSGSATNISLMPRMGSCAEWGKRVQIQTSAAGSAAAREARRAERGSSEKQVW